MRPSRSIGLLCILGYACSSTSETAPNPPPPPPPPPAPTPVVQAIRPSSAGAGTTSEFRIQGSGFEPGIQVTFSRTAPEPGFSATTLSVTNEEVRVRVSIAPLTAYAAYNVIATNPSGRQGKANEILLVDEVPAIELATPGSRGVVTVVLPSGVAFGVGSGGCLAEDVGLPATWSAAGQFSFIAAPGSAGCSIAPLRAIGSELLGRGQPADQNLSASPLSWSALGQGGVQVFPVSQPPVGQRFNFDNIGASGLYLGHATDTTDPGGKRLFPFVWSQASGWTQLRMPPGVPSCTLSDANSGGEIVGWCTPLTQITAVYWSGPLADPVLLPLPPGATGGSAYGINEGGVIVGTAGRAVRWTPAGAGWTLDLLGDPGEASSANYINSGGWIAGTVGIRAALWSPAGRLRLLGRLEQNQVCAPGALTQTDGATPPLLGGRCFRAGNVVMRPVLWRP
ncbi:MAG TPA: hypothetical protein VJ817_15115 [Gemmatimonadales bacterium]|nr:hypothetical protein [Gemmatimonadales bacterium]